MAPRFQVTCIHKLPNHHDAHTRITNIGGYADGKPWKITSDQAIGDIQTGKFEFYVSVGGRSVNVIVATHYGRPYLKTTADGYSPDNLLSLPECP